MIRSLLENALRTVLLRDRSLMTKLMVYSAVLIIFPMMMVGFISYHQTSKTLENDARRNSWQIIEQVKKYIEDYFHGFEINTLKIVNHPDTVSFLKLKSLEEANDSDIVPQVRNVLKNAAYSQSDVVNITLVLEGVQTINSAIQEDVSSVQGIENEYWYDYVPVIGRPKVYSRRIHWNNREEPVISVIKRIANPQTLEPFGMLIIDLNYKRLHEVAQKVRLGETGQGFLFIVNEQGYIVYHPDMTLIGTKIDEGLMHTIGNKVSGSFISDMDGSKTLFTFSRSDSLQWQVITSIPYDTLMKSSRESIGKMIFGTTAFFMLIALLLSFTLAASLVKPIRKIYFYMRRVENGDFKIRLPVETKDEIGKLSNGFNTMVNRLSQLLEEVYISKLRETETNLRHKETELKMLQAQINPHFLYNSLDTIRGMALEHDLEEISSMSSALARLLRYNVKNSSFNVTVEKEVEIVKIYLLIQQFRFEDRLEYEFMVPTWTLEQEILKFTLQPIVENSIVHGMERNHGKTLIRLTAELMTEEAFVVRISDNGPGMHPEKLEQLQYQLEEEKIPEEAHIGIMNVQRRIRHVYGKPYGVRIESIEGEGTEVSVVLPFRPRGKENGVSTFAGGG